MGVDAHEPDPLRTPQPHPLLPVRQTQTLRPGGSPVVWRPQHALVFVRLHHRRQRHRPPRRRWLERGRLQSRPSAGHDVGGQPGHQGGSLGGRRAVSAAGGPPAGRCEGVAAPAEQEGRVFGVRGDSVRVRERLICGENVGVGVKREGEKE